MRLKKTFALFLILQLTVGPFTQPRRAYAKGMNEEARTADASAQEDDDDARDTTARKGLVFRLSEGAEESGAAAPRPTQAPAEKLSDSETARVLQRLPPLKIDETDAREFALRERSLPPPRAGATVLNAFPSDDERRAPDADAGGELRV